MDVESALRNDWMMDTNMSLRKALSASSRLLINSETNRARVSSDCRRSMNCEPKNPSPATARAASNPPTG